MRADSRVVVTGIGPVSSIGIGVRAFTDALRSGRSGISPVRSFDTTGFPHRHAGEVHDFEPARILRRLDPARWGRSSLFAAAAARLALADAGLVGPPASPDRIGCVMGTTSGESQVVEAVTAQAVAGGHRAADARLLAQIPAARLANAVNEELAITGESMTIGTACSASNYAIGYAYDLLATGEADVVLAGGADAVCRWSHAGFTRLGALSPEACTPFDRDRSGIITAEGGVALALERLEHATERGARIYAEVLGYGLNCDARHMVAPDADSMAACMRLAHQWSNVKPSEVDYICAHGTGTPSNDRAEALAVRAVFGDRVPPVSSIKSMLGHTMGAASGFGAAASVLAIHEGFLPPTAGWRTADPELPWIDPVPNQARQATVRVAQNNGHAFGGNNCITLFGELR